MAVLSWDEVAAVALKGGWPPGPAAVATAITEPESGRNATIIQQGQPYATTGWGLWQITPGNSVPQFGINDQLLNPLNNAKAGHWKWQQAGGFSPWTTYAGGLELAYLAEGKAAVAAVTGLSPSQLDKLVAQALKNAPGGGVPSATVQDWSPMVKKSASHARRMASSSHATSVLITAMRPGTVHPVVRQPLPGDVLWTPGQPLPV